jgi:hypothetical protein
MHNKGSCPEVKFLIVREAKVLSAIKAPIATATSKAYLPLPEAVLLCMNPAQILTMRKR